jgi:hypothetical protein
LYTIWIKEEERMPKLQRRIRNSFSNIPHDSSQQKHHYEKNTLQSHGQGYEPRAGKKDTHHLLSSVQGQKVHVLGKEQTQQRGRDQNITQIREDPGDYPYGNLFILIISFIQKEDRYPLDPVGCASKQILKWKGDP